MRTHGIFDVVAKAIHAELAVAATALEPWPKEPPTPLLGQLADVLRVQIENLTNTTGS
jgi:hypothetical protein